MMIMTVLMLLLLLVVLVDDTTSFTMMIDYGGGNYHNGVDDYNRGNDRDEGYASGNGSDDLSISKTKHAYYIGSVES